MAVFSHRTTKETVMRKRDFLGAIQRYINKAGKGPLDLRHVETLLLKADLAPWLAPHLATFLCTALRAERSLNGLA